jgi:hypothetical protein
MSDYTFPVRTYVRIDMDEPAWFVVEPWQTLGTIRPFTAFDTLEGAKAAGYTEPDGPEPS